MKSNNKHRGLVLSSTFVGLVCGLVLTHQQAYAAQTPPVSNQQNQITTVSDNNLNPTAAVNSKSYSSNISHPTPVSYNVTPNTYNSPETGLAARQQIANSDVTAAVATPSTGVAAPVANETATSTNSGNNNSTNPATSSPTQDTGNSASTPVAASNNQTNGNSNTTSTSSEQPETNIIDQGIWGTSKWDYTQEGDDYILHLHAGTLETPGKDKDDNGYIWDAGIGSLNTAFKSQLTQIVIDPGVIANQDSRSLFSYLKKLQTIRGLENLDTSQVTNMSSMFEMCNNLTNLDLSHFDTSKVTDMSRMFGDCKNLTSLDLSSFDTSQVTHVSGMLAGCINLHHLVLGPKIQLIDPNGWISDLPAVPATGTKIPRTDKIVTAPYWVATSGYQQGKRYTSDELQQLTGRDQVTTYDWDSQVPYQETVESKSVTRTINVHYPDGQVKTIQDTVDLSRKVKVKADGSKTYGEWSTAQWEAYTVPELAGYQANQSKIPAQTVDSNTTDTTIDILYEPLAQTIVIQYLDQGQVVGTQKLIGYTGETLIPNYHAPQGYEITSSPQPNITVDATGKQIIQVNVSHKITQSAETLTKTRTINIHLPNATVKTYRQVAVIKRNVAVDQVTGSKSYGPWHNNSWDAMDIPIIEGYTANQNSIAAKEVTAETENETIDIFYVQN